MSKVRSQLQAIEVTQCPACGCVGRTLIGSVDDTLVAELKRMTPVSHLALGSWENRLFRCDECGLGYLSPRFSTASLQRLYDLWYRFGYPSMQRAVSAVSTREARFQRTHLRYLERVAPGKGRLLDIGTGTGEFVSAAERSGWDAEGIDWSEEAVATANRAGRPRVSRATLRDVSAAAGSYDAVTLFDYLEHTETPAQDMAEAAALLAQGGVMAVRVPNSRSLQSRLLGLRWNGVMSLHLSYFDLSSMTRLMAANGITPVLVKCGNDRSLWELLGGKASWIVSKFRQASTAAAGANTGAEVPVRTTRLRYGQFLIGTLHEVIEHFGGWLGQGSQLYVVGRKRHV